MQATNTQNGTPVMVLHVKVSCGTQGTCWPRWQTGQPLSCTWSVLSAIALLQVKIRLICGVPGKCETQLNSVMLSSDHTPGQVLLHSAFFVLGNKIVGLNTTHQLNSLPVHEVYVQVDM